MIKKIQRFVKGAYLDWTYPSLFQVLRNPERVVVYYGYLSDYNYGDIMVFQAAEKLLGPDAIIIPVKRRMPPFLRLLTAQLSTKNRKLVIGGGTLMGSSYDEDFYLKFISKPNTRILLHGTGSTSGICDNDFWPTLLRKSTYGGLRGSLSQEVVRAELSIETTAFGDAAIALYESKFWEESAPTRKPESLLINMGTHHEFEGMNNSRLVISKVAENALAKNKRVGFLPMHKSDERLGMSLKEDLPGLEIYPIPKTIEEAIDILHKHDFAFGERLHFVVLAVLAKCPFLSVNYRPKHTDFLQSINMTHAGFDARDLSVEMVEQAANCPGDEFIWNDCQAKLLAIQDKQALEYQKFFAE